MRVARGPRQSSRSDDDDEEDGAGDGMRMDGTGEKVQREKAMT